LSNDSIDDLSVKLANDPEIQRALKLYLAHQLLILEKQGWITIHHEKL